MPTYNVKGKTVLKWTKQVDARNEEDAEEKGIELAESEVGGDDYSIVNSEVNDIEEVEYDG